MEYGKIKVGDIMIFTDEAKLNLASEVDNNQHLVSEVIGNKEWEYVMFEDGSGADSHWLFKVEDQNNNNIS